MAKEIFQAIKQCDFIIPIMTGGYATSLWCLRELYYAALQTDPKRSKTIIPMLLENEDVIDDQKAGKWLLRIGTVHKYFKKEEKANMIKSLKDKVFSILSTHELECDRLIERYKGLITLIVIIISRATPKYGHKKSFKNRPLLSNFQLAILDSYLCECSSRGLKLYPYRFRLLVPQHNLSPCEDEN